MKEALLGDRHSAVTRYFQEPRMYDPLHVSYEERGTCCEMCGTWLSGVHDLLCIWCLYAGEWESYYKRYGEQPIRKGLLKGIWDGPKMVFTAKFWELFKESGLSYRVIGEKAEVHHSWLYNHKYRGTGIFGMDERAIRLGRVLGMGREEILEEK